MWYAQPMCVTVRFVRSTHCASSMYAAMRCAMAARGKTAVPLLTRLLSSSAGCSNRTQVHNAQILTCLHRDLSASVSKFLCECLRTPNPTKIFHQLYKCFRKADLYVDHHEHAKSVPRTARLHIVTSTKLPKNSSVKISSDFSKVTGFSQTDFFV